MDLKSKALEIEKQVSNVVNNNIRKNLEAKRVQLAKEEERAREAKAQGDLGENADYQIARDNCARFTVEILSLNETITAYENYSANYIPTGVVQIGSTVLLYDENEGGSLVVKLYPTGLGNAKLGAISVTSPVGKEILGHVAGERVTVKSPLGETLNYSIKEVY